MKTLMVEMLTSIIGTAGFLIFFRVSAKKAAPALVCSFLTWICYYILCEINAGVFLSVLASAVFSGILSETAARIFKAPSNVFLLPGLVPLLPGASLYYTMLSLITARYGDFTAYALKTAYAVFGIALGILFASVIFEYILILTNARRRIK